MRHLIYLTILFISLQLSGQNINGQLNEENRAISFANVMLYNQLDSNLAKFTYSDDLGNFKFENVKKGKYYIEASFIGLQNFRSQPIEMDDSSNIDLGKINMVSSGIKLSEIVVTAQKPMMEVKPDKIILNVAGSVLASGDDAFNLLRKAPGVLIDNNDKISLLGKSGIVIYIDGKPSPLKPADLANMLKTMSSSDIESIEIISNPSAKYEAQGTAGIINIKRKKLTTHGVNGSINLAARQGLTRSGNGGLNLNYKTDKLNVYGTGSYFNSNNLNFNKFTRLQNNLGFRTDNENTNNFEGYNTKVTGDYYLNKNSTLGFIAEYNADNNNSTNTSLTEMGSLSFNKIDSLLLNNGKSVADSRTANFNTNFYYTGNHESSFNIDINYGQYKRDNNSYTPNQYTNLDQSKTTSTFITRSLTPTTIDISTLKMDYERKLGSGKISGGLKSGLVSTDNSFNFYNITDNNEVLNINLSNRFKYDEWVNAAYINYATNVKKIGLNAGLRFENSNTKGDLIAMNPQNNKTVKRAYSNLFPSAGISYSPSKKHSLQLSYGRRINRPNYQDLNPFEFQLDQLTFEKGNAFLNPEYTDNIQLTHTFLQKLTTSLSYSHTLDVITRLVDTSGLKATFITWDNIAYRKIYNASMSMPFSFSEKWSTFTNLGGTHTRNKASFDDGKTINLNVNSFNLYHQQSYKFNNDWNAEMSGWYRSPSIWEGTFIMEKMWSMGVGISKKFNGGSSKLTLNVDDIFKTNIWKGETNFGGLQMNVSGGWDSRRVRLSYNYNFGKQSNNKSRRRSTGLEEEQQRIKKS